MTTTGGLLNGPAAYVPRTGWPAWAVLPAAFGIFALAALVGFLATLALGALSPQTAFDATAPDAQQVLSSQMMMQLAAWIAGLQVGIIALTLAAAGAFGSNRAAALALVPPAGGWRTLLLALVPLFVVSAAWTGTLLLWKPSVVLEDLQPFKDLLHSPAAWVIFPVICIGAPLSEELLFRGFLFSGLAKSRLGLIGTSILTALLWTSLHAGYTIFGLIEVLGIGLYLSWVLVRTGSLWATIFCHAVYNTVIATVLLFVVSPA